MHDLIVDLGKEIVVSLLSLAVGAIWHKARRVFKDVNCFFARVRTLEEKVSNLEKGDKE